MPKVNSSFYKSPRPWFYNSNRKSNEQGAKALPSFAVHCSSQLPSVSLLLLFWASDGAEEQIAVNLVGALTPLTLALSSESKNQVLCWGLKKSGNARRLKKQEVW